ncbi:MAG TPA: hypothetical protein VN368_02160 [Candidatus Methylomirabilis sp.]|nr:hypothetical protein [Candidatus Methylomirabilis sp.]
MKDTLVVFMTARRCEDSQYCVDKAFSRILGLYENRREKNGDEVREK